MSREEQLAVQQDKYPALFEIDRTLDQLVRRIELLTYVNPLNVEKEKHRFFASKFLYEPEFKYPKQKFKPYELHRLFFAQPLEKISDPSLYQLFKDVIYHYANMVQCIESIGRGKEFYYNSLRIYGTPRERDVENAKFILHFPDEAPSGDMEKVFTANDARNYFEDFSRQYDFPLNIRFSTHIAADAMVSNATQTLMIKRNALFSKNQLLTLANHEIGVHLVTTFNGLLQPLKIFSHGFPKNVETQEGLAVFSEYMSGALTLKRLKELAYRVIASDSLIKGYNFSDTFDLIHNQHKLNKHEAFSITLRAHRGGGFTKDRLYLSGLQKIYRRYREGKSMDVLLTGKVALEYEQMVHYLNDLGLASRITHGNNSFQKKRSQDKTLDFILDNLK